MEEPITKPDLTKEYINDTNIKVTKKENSLEILIPAKGIKGKGILSLVIISLWLFTMLVWTIILLMMKPLYMLYSVPFWAIGFITLYKSLNILRLEQMIIVHDGKISLKLTRGHKYEVREFSSDARVNLIEGSYYSYSGLNRRGQFPAIISEGEAFSFAERASSREKSQLISLINNYLNQPTN